MFYISIYNESINTKLHLHYKTKCTITFKSSWDTNGFTLHLPFHNYPVKKFDLPLPRSPIHIVNEGIWCPVIVLCTPA